MFKLTILVLLLLCIGLVQGLNDTQSFTSSKINACDLLKEKIKEINDLDLGIEKLSLIQTALTTHFQKYKTKPKDSDSLLNERESYKKEMELIKIVLNYEKQGLEELCSSIKPTHSDKVIPILTQNGTTQVTTDSTKVQQNGTVKSTQVTTQVTIDSTKVKLPVKSSPNHNIIQVKVKFQNDWWRNYCPGMNHNFVSVNLNMKTIVNCGPYSGNYYHRLTYILTSKGLEYWSENSSYGTCLKIGDNCPDKISLLSDLSNAILNNELKSADGTWTIIPTILMTGNDESGRRIVGKVMKSCFEFKEYLNNITSLNSGTYWINPSGKEDFKVYCDMITNGGGYTLIAKTSNPNDSVSNFKTIADLKTLSSLKPEFSKGSIWDLMSNFNLYKDSIMFMTLSNTKKVIYKKSLNREAYGCEKILDEIGTSNYRPCVYAHSELQGRDKQSLILIGFHYGDNCGTGGLLYGRYGSLDGCWGGDRTFGSGGAAVFLR